MTPQLPIDLERWMSSSGIHAAVVPVVASEEPVPGQPQAGPKRRAEFHAGRRAARKALSHAGVPAAHLSADQDGVPVWPAGFLGSISHTDTLAAAIVASQGGWLGLGLDFEPQSTLSQDEISLIRRPDEDQTKPPMLTFVAKEAAYKAIFPSTRRMLEFHDFRIRFTPGSDTYDAEPSISDPVSIRGRWRQFNGVFAAVAWSTDRKSNILG